MKKFDIKRFVFVIFTVLLVMSIFTGCSDGVEEDKTTGSVSFRSNDVSSRGLAVRKELVYPVEDLYWTFTAQKLDGLYTEGESTKIASGVYNPGSRDSVYVERPVKAGPASGLSGFDVGPFATGDWKFRIYGYRCCKVVSGRVVFTDIVYEGNTYENTKVVAGAVSDVLFELSVPDDCPLEEEGYLTFDTMKLTVPEDMKLFGSLTGTTGAPDTVVKVKVWVDSISASTKVAESTTVITEDKVFGDVVTLSGFVISTDSSGNLLNAFSKGLHPVYIAAEYQDKYTKERFDEYSAGSSAVEPSYSYSGDDAIMYDNGFAPIGEIKKFPLDFRTAERTVLFGDLNDMEDAIEDTSYTNGSIYVASIDEGTASRKLYKTLQEAVDEYTAGKVITLLANVKDAGTLTLSSSDVTLNPNDYFISNLTLSGAKSLVVSPGNVTTRKYTFSGNGKSLKNFVYTGSTVWLTTDGGVLTVDAASDDVYHSGNLDALTVTAVSKDASATPVSGFHLGNGATVSGEAVIVKGMLDIGAGANINELTVKTSTAGAVALKGRPTSKVGSIWSGTTPVDITNGHTGNTSKDASKAFRIITLNDHKSSASYYTQYAIEGMKVKIKAFSETGFSVPTRTNTQLEFLVWAGTADGGTFSSYTGWGMSDYVTDECICTAGSVDLKMYACYGGHLDGCRMLYADSSVDIYNYGIGTLINGVFKGCSAPSPNLNVVLTNYVWFYKKTAMPATDRYYVVYGGRVEGRWGFFNQNVGETATAIGTGKTNTVTMLSKTDTSGYGRNLWDLLKIYRERSGYSDLFIGSMSECALLYTASLTGKVTDTWVTTSSTGVTRSSVPGAGSDPAGYTTHSYYTAVNAPTITARNHGDRCREDGVDGNTFSSAYGTYFLRAF